MSFWLILTHTIFRYFLILCRLVVSVLPYSPPFALWQDAYDYLLPLNGLKRGSRIFWREHCGAVSVGSDQKLYAANKHFVYVITFNS